MLARRLAELNLSGSGLFFFRELGVPFLSHTYFYMAVPDWDIPLFQVTRLPCLIHRSWVLHSFLIPIGGLGITLWLSRHTTLTHWQSYCEMERSGWLWASVRTCCGMRCCL